MSLEIVTNLYDCPIYCDEHNNGLFTELEQFIGKKFTESKKIIFVDSNTLKYCFPVLQKNCASIQDAEIIEIEGGELSKDLEICKHIWQTLLDMKADRNTLFINLGGGVVSDLGGFIASVYKRGIPFINIPTTLLAQTDAATGGKNGIDFMDIKNILGTITQPQAVFISPVFLKTLPKREILSGFAEMLKHGLIADKNYWNELKIFAEEGFKGWGAVIKKSIKIKSGIVIKDPNEKNLRKLLNFGHTIGHAIESFSIKKGKALLHGEAVAIGMLCESYISHKISNLSLKGLNEIWTVITLYYPQFQLQNKDVSCLLELMYNDKKSLKGKPAFSLISAIGKGEPNVQVPEDLIIDAIHHYIQNCAVNKPIFDF